MLPCLTAALWELMQANSLTLVKTTKHLYYIFGFSSLSVKQTGRTASFGENAELERLWVVAKTKGYKAIADSALSADQAWIDANGMIPPIPVPKGDPAMIDDRETIAGRGETAVRSRAANRIESL